METRLIKMSEKLKIWMMRNKKTQIEVASMLGITRQTLADKMETNFFKAGEIIKLKELGVE